MVDENNTELETKPDVVIVGAGPVGLVTAIELKTRDPNCTVLIVEKHPEYTRKQSLRLDYLLLSRNLLIKKELDKAIANGNAKLSTETKSSIDIPIQVLEKCLQNCAKELKIKTEYKQISSVDELEASYPNCKTMIAADGSRSVIRKSLFGEDASNRPTTSLQYMIELKYEAEGDCKKLAPELYNFLQLRLRGFLADKEYIKYNPNTNTSEITQRFLVDKETYEDEALVNAKAGSPLKLTQRIPYYLRSAIAIWLNARGDKIVVPSLNPKLNKPNELTVRKGSLGPCLNKTILEVYKSKQSHRKQQGNKPSWFLVGDSLMGLSFMKGATAGIACGMQFAEKFSSGISEDKLCEEYHQFTNDLFEQKIAEVKKINEGIITKKGLLMAARVISAPFKPSFELLPLNATSAEHPIFGKIKPKWPWLLGGFLLGAGLAVTSLFLSPLAIPVVIGITVVGAIIGAWIGKKIWQWKGPYEDVEIEAVNKKHRRAYSVGDVGKVKVSFDKKLNNHPKFQVPSNIKKEEKLNDTYHKRSKSMPIGMSGLYSAQYKPIKESDLPKNIKNKNRRKR